ncbi:hypothetical protein SD10_19355 [Spirosoma radiotolerans]|uniref:Uncharacterized protein n=1 Tax=Spirosoma radiotolerans TaxID=1379870 RepID=A0A0E3V8G6_9BACT|nr:hypothetical protein SD10_19355 [Spirosoma radiotolerans]
MRNGTVGNRQTKDKAVLEFTRLNSIPKHFLADAMHSQSCEQMPTLTFTNTVIPKLTFSNNFRLIWEAKTS